jgi:4-hydroxy-3-methylbut-2-enyl diphosphate reductase
VLLVQNVADVEKLKVNDENNLAYVTQTTLSLTETRGIIEALKNRFPNIVGPETKDICYATQNRQDAVAMLAPQVDLLLVVGAKNSSNSNRLKDLGEELGTRSYLIDDSNQLKQDWFNNVKKVGLTAGASAPEILVQQVIDKIRSMFSDAEVITMDGIEENVKFHIPKALRKTA